MGGGRWGVVRDRLASYKQRHDCDAVRHPSYQATNTNEAGTLETQKTGKKKKKHQREFRAFIHARTKTTERKHRKIDQSLYSSHVKPNARSHPPISKHSHNRIRVKTPKYPPSPIHHRQPPHHQAPTSLRFLWSSQGFSISKCPPTPPPATRRYTHETATHL